MSAPAAGTPAQPNGLEEKWTGAQAVQTPPSSSDASSMDAAHRKPARTTYQNIQSLQRRFPANDEDKDEDHHHDDEHHDDHDHDRHARLMHMLGLGLLGGMAFGLLVMVDKKAFLPASPAWATLVIWACSHVAGSLVGALGLPPLLGMLISGIILKNAGAVVDGLTEDWSAAIRAMGLSVILMRSGLELDFAAFKRVGPAAARLTALPGITEAVIIGVFSIWLFGMTGEAVWLGLTMGFILAAVSPAVVVIGMFELQRKGYGVAKGIPSLVVAAASFDDVLAISGFSICMGLAVPHGSLAWTIAHGPLNLVFGLISGALGGALLSMTSVWESRWKRSVASFVVAMIIMFAGKKYHFTGAGAMGSLICGIFAAMGWQRGWFERWHLSLGHNDHFSHDVESDLASFWRVVAQPLLFGVIGAAVDFDTLDGATLPRAVGIVIIGLCGRLPAAFVAVGNAGLTYKERLYIALSWIPKATVQAALGSVPLDVIREYMYPEGADSCLDDQECVRYERWGNEILTTAVLSIILTAPVGLLVINALGPKWLEKADMGSLESSHVDLAALPGGGEDSAGGGGGAPVELAEIKVETNPEVERMAQSVIRRVPPRHRRTSLAALEMAKKMSAQQPALPIAHRRGSAVPRSSVEALASAAIGGRAMRRGNRRTSLAPVMHEMTQDLSELQMLAAFLELQPGVPESQINRMRSNIDHIKNNIRTMNRRTNTHAEMGTRRFFALTTRKSERRSSNPGDSSTNEDASEQERNSRPRRGSADTNLAGSSPLSGGEQRASMGRERTMSSDATDNSDQFYPETESDIDGASRARGGRRPSFTAGGRRPAGRSARTHAGPESFARLPMPEEGSGDDIFSS